MSPLCCDTRVCHVCETVREIKPRMERGTGTMLARSFHLKPNPAREDGKMPWKSKGMGTRETQTRGTRS